MGWSKMQIIAKTCNRPLTACLSCSSVSHTQCEAPQSKGCTRSLTATSAEAVFCPHLGNKIRHENRTRV